MTVYYDTLFNKNEWFIIVLLIAAYIAVLLLPKRFPLLISAVFLLYGIFVGFFVDNTIGLPPFDLYDVNDSYYFELFDFLTYVMYGPFSYFIVYFFDRFRMRRKHLLIYIVFWSLTAVGFEWLGINFEVYQYEKGWRLQYSFPSYLLICSFLMILYYKLCRQRESEKKAR